MAQPVLQIIHVSDLHFKDLRCDDAVKFYTDNRIGARALRNFVIKRNLCGWEEGTQGHYQYAPGSFERFLGWWKENNPRWFSKDQSFKRLLWRWKEKDPGQFSNNDAPQTWLIDTGDLTTFGDDFSLRAGKSWMAKWCGALGNVRSRELYGNHDAWPSYHPGPGLTAVEKLKKDLSCQRDKVVRQNGWDTSQWLTEPLTVNIPGTESRIELYAMNTVCWTPLDSVLAVGRLDETTLAEFRQHVESQYDSDSIPHFRILATHHPIAFPYLPEEKLAISPSPWPSAMQLQKAGKHIRFFKNEGRQAQIGPLVHLFLSGHTHAGYPAGDDLPPVVSEIYQGQLHRYQLQLVVGPLMLNKSRKPEDRQPTRTVDGYGKVSLNLSNCQAQILQFWSDPDIPGELRLYRIPVAGTSGRDYKVVPLPPPVQMVFSTPT